MKDLTLQSLPESEARIARDYADGFAREFMRNDSSLTATDANASALELVRLAFVILGPQKEKSLCPDS